MLTIGIPYVLTFYVLVAALEDSGYLTSAAVLMDRVFNVLGLPGRTAVPAAHRGRLQRARDLRDADPGHPPGAPPGRVPRHAHALLGADRGGHRRARPVRRAARRPGRVRRRGRDHLRGEPGRERRGARAGSRPSSSSSPPFAGRSSGTSAAKAWSRFRSFVIMATPIMLVGSFVLGLVYESGLWVPLAAVLGPITETLLGPPGDRRGRDRLRLPAQGAGPAAAPRAGDRPVRRRRGAPSAASCRRAQLFVFAIVVSISVPCAATLATLADEFGWRPALGMAGATLVLALGTGVVLARALGIAPA